MSAEQPVVSSRQVADVHVARVVGEIDHARAPQVAPELAGAMASASAVVLDLTAVTYLDSAGVRLLDGVTRACGERAVPLRIVAPEGGAARLALELCAFPGHLLAPTLEQGVAALSAGGR